MTEKKAIRIINKEGALLVFPVKNQPEPDSLWRQFYPRTPMKWDWDETGDDRVVNLWHLMKVLSDSGEVVYSKWYRDRATFFSKDLFRALVCFFSKTYELEKGLIFEAQSILDLLSQDSPLSTKEIKEACELQGSINQGLYSKAMKQLFRRFLIVSFGEKEDGAFPSALMGATSLIFEELVREAQALSLKEAKKIIDSYWPESTAFGKQLIRYQKSLVLAQSV